MKEDLLKVVSLLLVGLLVCESSVLAAQATPITATEQVQKQEAAQAAKTTGEKSQVKARLVNRAELKGYVSKIEESSFPVAYKKSGQSTTAPLCECAEDSRTWNIQRRQDCARWTCGRSCSLRGHWRSS